MNERGGGYHRRTAVVSLTPICSHAIPRSRIDLNRGNFSGGSGTSRKAGFKGPDSSRRTDAPCGGPGLARPVGLRAADAIDTPSQRRQGRYGETDERVRVALHQPDRQEGARVRPGVVPPGAGAGRLRGPLLLSLAGHERGGCGRLGTARPDRGASLALPALHRGTRLSLDGLLRALGAAGHGRGGPRRADADAARLHGDRRGSDLRRPGLQVPALGAEALRRARGRGAAPGAGAQAGRGDRRDGA